MTGQMPSFREALGATPGPALGAWVKLGSDDSTEILARTGFDFLVVDMEHSTLSSGTAFAAIRTATACGVPVMVRSPGLDRVTYQRLLDAGASTILAPQIDEAAEVRAGLSFAHYPPRGVRGFATTTRAGNWGRSGPDAHLERSSAALAFIPQLESPAAFANLDEMLDQRYLEAVFVGRTDLAVAAGVAHDDESLDQLIDRALALCHRRDVLVGTAVSGAGAAQTTCEQGFDFIVIGDDASWLASTAREALAAARPNMKAPDRGEQS